jgi:hypothetical protein
MPDRRRRIRSQARPALIWTLLFFVGGHLAAGLYLHRHHLEFFDSEMTLLLRKLPARLAEAPQRPLALALGSSRIAWGLRPASVMEQATANDPPAVLFNFSMRGLGPVGQRLVLHRLLRRGKQPKWLVLEAWPPFLTQRSPFNEETRMDARDVYWSDVPIFARLYHRRWEAIGQVIAQTLTPLLPYREPVLAHYAPALLPPMRRPLGERVFEKHLPYHLDDFGWVEYDVPHTDDHAFQRHIKPLFDNFFIHPFAERAWHDLLEECRAHHIQVLFLLMPDHSLVRGWYDLIQDKYLPYLRRLSAENYAPIVDARAWQPDEDIPDYCHLSPKGARSFSERFGREVYRPLLQGRPLAKDILLRDP